MARLLPLMAFVLLALVACRGADERTEADPAADTGAWSDGVATPRPRLRPMVITDGTPPEVRPVDLGEAIRETVEQAMRGPEAFEPAPEDDLTSCAAEAGVLYVLVVNGEPRPDAEAGEARMAIEATVQCPAPPDAYVDTETFHATVDEAMPFGEEHGVTGEEALRRMLGDLAERAAHRVYGQVLVRHADDADVLEVLAEEERPGLLAEAASEAGERKLREAIPHLVRLTGHDDEVVVLRAGGALGLLGASQSEALRALAKMTEGSNTERHLIAIHALGDIGGSEAARYLNTIAVGHPIAPIREAARDAADRARSGGDGR